MLEVAQLSCAYGKHQALADVSLDVGHGQIVAVLGANGAGKSTLLKAIAGLVEPLPGARITLNGHTLVGLPAHHVVERGVAIVPEGRGIFGDLTVRENLLLGAYPARARAGETKMLARVLALFPRLTERLTQAVSTMSGGEQQMVAIGRALMSNPDCLLLDEPSLGLSPMLGRELFRALLDIRSAGVGILLVEQNARAALGIADRAYLVSGGRNAGSGEAAELKNNPDVQRAYLGSAASSAGAKSQSMESPMNAISMLIGGKDQAASGRRTFDRLNPVTGKTASVVAAASVQDALRAVDAAAKAFAAWSQLGPSERRHRLNAAADALARRAPEFVALMTAETGATAGWAGFNVHLAEGMLREAAAMTTQIAGEVIPTDKPDNLAMAFRQPAGVVLGIAPWNAPVILGVRAVAMPLACGNTVVLKASEMSPGVHRLIGTCLADAGLGDGVVNVVTNAPADAEAIVEALIAHPAVRRVNFTGSTRVGRLIAVACARHLKRVLLELGGKAPLVVLDDADIDAAVNAAAFGAFMNQGQICMSTERIVVDDKVADAFVARFAAKAKSLPHGDPRKGDVVLGALVSKAAAERVAALIEDALAKGAKLAAGGPGEGVVMPATIIDHVTPAMRVYGDESFGPVVAVVRVSGIEEAVRVANDTEYGLSSAVFGRDIARAMSVAKRLETGICHINAPTVHDEPQMPFGGAKASGYGRFGGRAAIDEFTELRWITVQTGPRHYPF
jgi:vanillin dehydrogenase